VLACTISFVFTADAEPPAVNYDEARVGDYTLPEVLKMQDGTPVKTAADWLNKRRPEVLRLFEENVYGKAPASWGTLECILEDKNEDALGGIAVRKLLRLRLKEYPQWSGIEVLLYLPKKASGPVPCFIGLNFKGNHACTLESDIPVSTNWLRDSAATKSNTTTQAPESTRGSNHGAWVPEKVVAAGFGLATAYYGDIEADYAGGWALGVRGALSPQHQQTEWKSDDWGGIGAWAWGLSRMLDGVANDPAVDSTKCAVLGHSRLGKAALWAGAQDARFSIVIGNESGEAGAALMRRNYGETVAIITGKFPHWFAGRFASYANNEAQCPVDQHMLIALCAPRPVAIGSALEDRWADPRGEYLGGVYASPVYELFGKTGLVGEWTGSVCSVEGEAIGYHLRDGKHDLTSSDWEEYIKFCSHRWSWHLVR